MTDTKPKTGDLIEPRLRLNTRLENIDQLQWEIDGWMRHFLNWPRDGNFEVIGKSAEKARALDKVAQILFDTFGQPDPRHKASPEPTYDDRTP